MSTSTNKESERPWDGPGGQGSEGNYAPYGRVGKSRLVLVTDIAMDRHETSPGHPENHKRLIATIDGIEDAGLGDRLLKLPPEPAGLEDLARVHEVKYVRALEAFCREGGGALDADTEAGPHSYDTALLAAGSGLVAIKALKSQDASVAFVASRPPGHHATRYSGMGFCLFNNIAVAAAYLVDQGERVFIFDWDVHHGNGTQDIFYQDPRVLYTSVHQAGWYPGTGMATETGGLHAPGSNLNIPLPSGTTGDVVLGALATVIAPVVEAFRPSWVLVSAGYDGHKLDPLAEWELSSGDYSELTTEVMRIAAPSARVAFFLEGGYNLNAVKESARATVRAALDLPFDSEEPTSGGPGLEETELARSVWIESP